MIDCPVEAVRLRLPLQLRIVPSPANYGEPGADEAPADPRRSMRWAQRLRRVFNIDIETGFYPVSMDGFKQAENA